MGLDCEKLQPVDHRRRCILVENFGRGITLATCYNPDYGLVENGEGATTGVWEGQHLLGAPALQLPYASAGRGAKKRDRHFLQSRFVQKFG